MTHMINREFRDAMDGLTFSQQEKAAMTQALLRKTERKSFSGRKLLMLSFAVVLILTTMTAAAVYTRWPDSIVQDFPFRGQDKQTAEQSGLASFPSTISVTDQGVTISVAQTLMDPYRAVLIFRIEGVKLPEGTVPQADWEITMDGRYAANGAYGFFNGILETSPGVLTYADGSPLTRDENGMAIPRFAGEDGSLEYSVSLTFDTPQSPSPLVTARCSGIYLRRDDEKIPLADGSWEFTWNMTSSDRLRKAEPNVPIGDSGYYLKRAELTSLTAILEISGTDRTSESPSVKRMSCGVPDLEGVMLKDGTFSPVPTGTICSIKPLGNQTVLCNSGIQVVDVAQIDALVFGNRNAELVDGEYIQCDSYIVPIS